MSTMINRAPLPNLPVLVTGATGFLGRHLIRRLSSENARVYAVARGDAPSRDAHSVWMQGDLSDADAARSILREVQPAVVYHLAGHATAEPGIEHVRPTFSSMVESTVNLLIASLDYGVRRIVLTGSMNEPTGSAEEVPRSPYAIAKWVASTYGRMFHALYGSPVVIVRPFMCYGPGQAAGKLIPYVTQCLLDGERPRLSSGCSSADWVFVDDVVDGLVAAATVGAIEGLTLDLGTGTTTSVKRVAALIGMIIGSKIEPEFDAIKDRGREVFRSADTLRTLDTLGWRAQTSVEHGLKKTVEWFNREKARSRSESRKIRS